MSNHYGRYYTDISQLPASAPTGWYTFYNKTFRQYVPVYVDQDYDGGGWVCVIANRRYTAGMHNLTYDDVINTPNYRTEPSSNNGTNTTVAAPDTYNEDLTDYNILIGLKFWDMFGGRHASGKISIAQYITNTGNGIKLSTTGSHTFRSRWYFTNFDSGNYWKSTGTGFTSNEVGSTSPGMYSYHFANAYSMTTYDADHDVWGGNCSTNYNNNPFWYGACWSGNQFAGGGHVDGPYWSGSGTSYQYGAVYIK